MTSATERDVAVALKTIAYKPNMDNYKNYHNIREKDIANLIAQHVQAETAELVEALASALDILCLIEGNCLNNPRFNKKRLAKYARVCTDKHKHLLTKHKRSEEDVRR